MVRFKFRYFFCEIDLEEFIELLPLQILKMIKDAVFENFGLIGLSKISNSL